MRVDWPRRDEMMLNGEWCMRRGENEGSRKGIILRMLSKCVKCLCNVTNRWCILLPGDLSYCPCPPPVVSLML